MKVNNLQKRGKKIEKQKSLETCPLVERQKDRFPIPVNDQVFIPKELGVALVESSDGQGSQ